MKQDVILERVYVETPLDTDGDGARDLVAVYIRRPAGCSPKNPTPAVFVANPYMLDCNEDWYNDLHPVDTELRAYADGAGAFEPWERPTAPPAGLPAPRAVCGRAQGAEITEAEYEIVVRNNNPFYQQISDEGYAVVFCGGLGTRGSQGFLASGSYEELTAFVTVIDWLCGRARAFTDREGGIEIAAEWCNGRVAMTGKSYLGTLCYEVATMAPQGLVTIIPEAGILSWYDYYRQNGLCTPALDWQGDDIDLLTRYCFSRTFDPDWPQIKDAFFAFNNRMIEEMDREYGGYNRFWDERNYLRWMDRVQASILIVQGINDWNVKMSHAVSAWESMCAQGKPCRMLLHQGEHIRINSLTDGEFNRLFFAWLDHWLRGADNGIMEELAGAYVQSMLDPKQWMTSAQWPPEGSAQRRYRVKAGALVPDDGADCAQAEQTAAFLDDLSTTRYDRAQDSQGAWLDGLCLDEDAPYRLKYLAGAAGETLRLSGRPVVRFSAAIDRETAILSAMLVDYGEDRRLKRTPTGEEDAPKHFEFEEQPSPYRVITRGSLCAQNRSSLARKEAVPAGQMLEYTIPLVPTDWLLKGDHRLGLILYGTDAQQTIRPKTPVRVEIKLGSVSVELTALAQ